MFHFCHFSTKKTSHRTQVDVMHRYRTANVTKTIDCAMHRVRAQKIIFCPTRQQRHTLIVRRGASQWCNSFQRTFDAFPRLRSIRVFRLVSVPSMTSACNAVESGESLASSLRFGKTILFSFFSFLFFFLSFPALSSSSSSSSSSSI